MNRSAAAWLVFVFAAIASAPASYGADPPASQQAKLRRLQEQLDRLKTTHVKIVENQAKIKSELDTLKIWIRRQS